MRPDFVGGRGAEVRVTLVVPEIPRGALLVAKQRGIVFRGFLTAAPASTSVPGGRATLWDPPGVLLAARFPAH